MMWLCVVLGVAFLLTGSLWLLQRQHCRQLRRVLETCEGCRAVTDEFIKSLGKAATDNADGTDES